jgi:hypothetical protein
MMNTFLSVRLPAKQESPFKTGKQRSLVLWINGDENKSDAKSLLSVHEWRSAPQCYNLFLQLHQNVILRRMLRIMSKQKTLTPEAKVSADNTKMHLKHTLLQ